MPGRVPENGFGVRGHALNQINLLDNSFVGIVSDTTDTHARGGRHSRALRRVQAPATERAPSLQVGEGGGVSCHRVAVEMPAVRLSLIPGQEWGWGVALEGGRKRSCW